VKSCEQNDIDANNTNAAIFSFLIQPSSIPTAYFRLQEAPELSAGHIAFAAISQLSFRRQTLLRLRAVLPGVGAWLTSSSCKWGSRAHHSGHNGGRNRACNLSKARNSRVL
ncbi:hypothetical protein Vafri_154, partial [Volvox africanus]